MEKKWYAGQCKMGINFTYSSPCWKVFVFPSRMARNKWVEKNYWDGSKVVARCLTRKMALKIGLPDTFTVAGIVEED